MFQFFAQCRKHLGVIGLGLLVPTSILLTGYTDETIITSNKGDSLDLNPFVEKGFPFLPGTIDSRKLGPEFPNDNISARVVSVKVGDNAYMAYDTDLLRVTVAWTGKFLPMVLMPQISYNDFFNKGNKVPAILGKPQFATGSYAGWSTQKPAYESIKPRPQDNLNWDPMPAEQGRWNGIYAYRDQAILNYSVGKTNVYELPGGAQMGDQQIFTRTFRFTGPSQELFLTAAEVDNATSGEVKGKVAYLYHGTNKDSVTAVAVMGKGGLKLKVDAHGSRFLTVQVPASEKTGEASIALWRGPVTKKSDFEKYCKKAKITFPDFQNGGPAYWTETVITQGKLAPDTAAFVTDQLTLPLPNPWKRNVRIADIGFFEDGRGAAVTFEGDVWLIENIDKDLKNVKWKRFASGLHEPMSIEIIKNEMFVFGREGIVKLHDLNKDGNADFYENFSNVMSQSAESREWAADLVYGPDGSFYIAKGGSQSNGPGVSKQVAKGFREGSKHQGSILKIAKDGRGYEVIATGLRGPYLGMNPKTGFLTASDQQGNFVPSTPIYYVQKGDYFGVPASEHRTDNPPITPPLTWIPHRIDRSSISEAWVTSDKMGPLSWNLIHFSFARPGLFRVVVDSSAKVMQGGISFINANYPAPTSKGSTNPKDGQMYATGFNLWGSQSTGISSLLRLRYTGKPSYLPNEFRATAKGVMLSFDSEIDPSSIADLNNFEVKRWNYKRTEEYGSGHYKLDGTSGEETLSVAGAYISANRKNILLLVPDMKEVEQMDVGYKLVAKDGKAINDHFYFTVNNLSQTDFSTFGFSNIDFDLLTKKKPEPTTQPVVETAASAEKGKELFQKMACFGCHSDGTKTAGMYGPPFKNLYKSQRHFEDGSTAIADENYIKESILNPGAKIIKGYNEEMPSFKGILTDNDIESLTLFIKGLKK